MLRTKKILRDSVREYRGISLRAPVYVTLESIMECVIPLFDGHAHRLRHRRQQWRRRHGLHLEDGPHPHRLHGGDAAVWRAGGQDGGGGLRRLRQEPAPRSLLPRAGLLLFQHRALFHRQPRHPHDYGRHQRADGLPDAQAHTLPRPGDARFLAGDGLSHQPAAGGHLPLCHAVFWPWACFSSCATPTPSSSACSRPTTA